MTDEQGRRWPFNLPRRKQPSFHRPTRNCTTCWRWVCTWEQAARCAWQKQWDEHPEQEEVVRCLTSIRP